MNNNIFRKEALRETNLRWQGKAILLPKISSYCVSAIILVFFTLFIAFILSASYVRRVAVTGEVVTSPRPVGIFSSVQGFVTEKFVTEGQIIKKGDKIYRIKISKGTTTGEVSDNQRQSILNQIDTVDSIIKQMKISSDKTIESLNKQEIQFSEAIKKSSKIIKKAEEGTELMKINMNNYRVYKQKGLINQDQLTNQEALYYQQQNTMLSLISQKDQNNVQMMLVQNQRQAQTAEFDNRINQLQLQRIDLQKELVNVDVSGEVVVRSLSDGKVDSLSFTEGQMVQPGDSLANISPVKVNNYYLVVWATNAVMPYVSVGDKVNLRYQAFPVEKFGQFKAEVILISKNPASSREMDMYQGSPKNRQDTSFPYYKIIVKPAKDHVIHNGKSIPLENGMLASSTLFLEKRKMYQWILSPLYDMKRSSMGPVDE